MKPLLGILLGLCLQSVALSSAQAAVQSVAQAAALSVTQAVALAQNADAEPADGQLKIVALAPHIVESLFAIGAGEQVVATTDHADFPEAAKSIPRVGNYARLQIERILQLQPDVIIAWKTGNPQEDLARLEKYQLNIVYSHPQTLEDVADELLMLGEITGREEQAKQLADEYLNRLQALKNQYQRATQVTGFYEMWARPLRTVANKAWLQQQIALCGVANPFAGLSEDYPLVSLEKVLTSMPQVVIQPTPHSEASPDSLNWKKWPHIPASSNGFIFHPDADKTHRMTVRMLDELEALCQQIDTARKHYQTSSSLH